MAYKLEVDNPQFPKDAEFDCDGILVKNGESRTLTKEDEIGFIARWGRDIKDIYGQTGTVAQLTGTSELSKKERDELMPPASTTPGEEPEAEAAAEPAKKDGGE